MTSESERLQALNALWNAAGSYDIEPATWQVFTREALQADSGIPLDAVPAHELVRARRTGDLGAAVLYRNTASGLMWKHYDGPSICRFAASWEEDYRAARLDELCWLAFAEAAVAREMDARPALESLHAAFLRTLAPAGHAAVAELRGEDLSQEAITARVRTVARARYGFDGRAIRTPDAALHLGVSLLGLSMRPELDKPGREKLRIRVNAGITAAAGNQRMPAALARLLEARAQRKLESNRAYVEQCFGPLLCSPAQLEALERAACTGIHAGCRLWIADGSHAPGDLRGREFRSMQADADEQFARNRAFYAEQRQALEAASQKLSHMLDDRLHSNVRFPERGHRRGTLDASRAWRADALDDTAVFQRKVAIDAHDVSVDLLIDASGSRSDQQERIAAQALVLGSALARCRIPVRISAFSSLRDHTVLRVFCDAGEPAKVGNVLRFFAAGMNRDGLALRVMGQLMQNSPTRAGKRLLLVLTDGLPMDDHAMAAAAEGEREQDYLGKPAVRDTAAQVRALRRQGISVAALYQGPDDYLGHAKLIYGSQLVRIQHIERMASAAAMLVASALEEA